MAYVYFSAYRLGMSNLDFTTAIQYVCDKRKRKIIHSHRILTIPRHILKTILNLFHKYMWYTEGLEFSSQSQNIKELNQLTVEMKSIHYCSLNSNITINLSYNFICPRI